MDSVQSFRGYGKVDELEQAAFRKKTRKRVILVTISLIILVALIIGIVVGTLVHKNNKKNNNQNDVTSSPASAIKAVCSVTQYPDSCISSLSSSKSTDPEKIFEFSLQVVMSSLEKLSTVPDEWMKKTNDPLLKEGLKVCDSVIEDSIDSLNESISSMKVNDNGGKIDLAKIDDLRTWLSTTITDQETCLDALEEVNATFVDEIKVQMKNSSEYASNSLAIVSKLLGLLGDFNLPIHRRLLGSDSGSDFPTWVQAGDRRLLQAARPRPDVTVAKDGSGNVKTIKEAVAKIPKKSKTRFVIYVKAGVYVENVVLDKSLQNVMMYGDGMKATIVSGSLNFVDGTPTFSTATFAVAGKGFIARDMGFKNTAGPQKHQAVALRSGSDLSVFYRCSFDAFQDTLYAHSNRQFYRECEITGTVDFIFGNSAVVFQNCNILPRQPLANQFVTITAQGKKDPNQNTGISIQRCTMSPLGKLTAQTYLGRPWKDFSTTVIMQTSIDGFLNPKGWTEWVTNVAPPKTIFYAEYQNTGPGSSTANRVKWAGYRPNLTAAQASKFNVQSFIQGGSWLPATNVVFDST